MNEATFGQLLDEYLGHVTSKGNVIENVVYYHTKDGKPYLIVTESESYYDNTDIFSKHHDVYEEVELLKHEKETLQRQVRELEKTKTNVEKAVKLLAKQVGKL